ncbi:hypothetical protein [Acetilactobacillus jinshanensis]|uniref:Uncharacterized protein n=1 Tax=Acetilactobacillus jinshanensis TaxID=1720083 RepID=A0A4P6ZLK9_9LACO|nr:hypothetical protein [Acetilactobacillus jinshanensis]QBP18437.1 hypothetical protein ELX58_04650 [Acetilactobacillus jinshanensis]URL61308.1 hypothetical protein HGK75_04755 [uncultured bacterium]
MDILVHGGVVAARFIMKFLHFVTEKIFSDTLGLPYPIAEALTWLVVALVGVIIYKKWKR